MPAPPWMHKVGGLFAPQSINGGIFGDDPEPAQDARMAFAAELLSGSGYGPYKRPLGELMGQAMASAQQARALATDRAQQKKMQDAQIALTQNRIVPQGATVLGPDNQPVFTAPTAQTGANSRFGSTQIMQSGRIAALDRLTGLHHYTDTGEQVDPDDVASADMQLITMPDGSVRIVNMRRDTGTGPRSETVVDSDTAIAGAAEREAAETEARKRSEADVGADVALPETLAEIGKMRRSIESLITSDGFSTIYGLSGVIDPTNYMAGSDASDAEAKRNQLDAQAFGVSIDAMRGLGALSNAEGKRVSDAFTYATNSKISDEEALKAWQEVLYYLDISEQRAEQLARYGYFVNPPEDQDQPVDPGAEEYDWGNGEVDWRTL